MIYWFSIVAIRFSGPGMEIANWPERIQAQNYDEACKKAMTIAMNGCPVDEYWSCHKVKGIPA